MHPAMIDAALREMEIYCDSREKPTAQAKARYRRMNVPVIQKKLDCGDYSARCPLLDLSDTVAIERKMSIAELSSCFCQQRGRFKREFDRAKAKGMKIYLLIENGSLDMIYAHKYRTNMAPQAMIASLFAWLARYNCQVLFCDELNSGSVIHDVLYREMKERLEKMGEGD